MKRYTLLSILLLLSIHVFSQTKPSDVVLKFIASGFDPNSQIETVSEKDKPFMDAEALPVPEEFKQWVLDHTINMVVKEEIRGDIARVWVRSTIPNVYDLQLKHNASFEALYEKLGEGEIDKVKEQEFWEEYYEILLELCNKEEIIYGDEEALYTLLLEEGEWKIDLGLKEHSK